MINNVALVLIQLGALAVFVHLWFLYAALKRRNDIADVAWGLGFVLIAAIGFAVQPNLKTAASLGLVAFWGFRLATHIYGRFRRHDQEDRRYQEMRRGWGKHQLAMSWLMVFLGQGFFLILVAMPLIVLPQHVDAAWSPLNFLGLAVWLFGFVFESVADKQLKDFLLKPPDPARGRIMKSGLWKYSRHPNYFGEAVIWWGIWLITFGPLAWLTIIGPLTITFLLRFVSGVPLAEAGFKDDPEFEEYKRKTPPMLPNFLIK